MFVRLSRLVVKNLRTSLAIAIPVGKTIVCKRIVCGYLVSIYGRILPTNIIVLPINSYDVNLGMDWLASNIYVCVNAKKVLSQTLRKIYHFETCFFKFIVRIVNQKKKKKKIVKCFRGIQIKC